MSFIQKIRDKGAWIIFAIIAIALISFILQDSSLRRGNFFSTSSYVGSINGEKIDIPTFQGNVSYIENLFKQRGQDVQGGMANAQAWNFTVQQTLLQQEMDKLGIGFTSKEMADVLFGDNPPQWMRQQFTNQQTGVFDANSARQAFSQIKKTGSAEQNAEIEKQYLTPTKQQALYTKYAALLSEAVYVPKWMAEKTNADNNSVAKASYVFVPYSTINDSTVKVSDDEIDAYVKKHKSEYEREDETRTVQYVTFNETPSGADSNSVKDNLASLKNAFVATNDAASFIMSKNSDNAQETFATRSDFKTPYADTIMKLPVGGVFGPYQDNGKFTLAKLVAKRTAPDSAKVRHILVKFDNSGQGLSDSAAKKRIDSIAAAVQSGANFDSLVQKLSDDAGSKGTKGEYTFPYSQYGTISREFADVAFFSPAGTKKVVKVSNNSYTGYHYIEVLEQKNLQDAYEVAYITKPVSSSNETINNASNAASQFAAAAKDQKSFDATVKKDKLVPVTSQEIRKEDFSLGAIGGENRDFIKWIFNNDAGDVSDPYELGDQYIVAIITSDDKAGLPSARTARPLVENIVRNQKKAKTIIDTKMKGSTLDAVAKSAGVSVMQADSLSFQSPLVQNVGYEPKMLGAAFDKNTVSKMSSPIAGSAGVFAVQSKGVTALASNGMSVEQVQNALRQTLQQQQNSGGGVFEALRKSASITDNRSTIY